MFKRLVGAGLLVLALAVPAFGVTVNEDGSTYDGNRTVVPWTLAIRSAENDSSAYGTYTAATPDTTDFARHGILFGPTATPVDLYVMWVPETGLTFGNVQFKERAEGNTATYTWGDVARIDISIVEDSESAPNHYFEVGLWESVRVWATASDTGLCYIGAVARVLK